MAATDGKLSPEELSIVTQGLSWAGLPDVDLKKKFLSKCRQVHKNGPGKWAVTVNNAIAHASVGEQAGGLDALLQVLTSLARCGSGDAASKDGFLSMFRSAADSVMGQPSQNVIDRIQPESVQGVAQELLIASNDNRGVLESASQTPLAPPNTAVSSGTQGDLTEFDGWSDDPRRGQSLLQEGLQHLKRRDADAAVKCFDAAIRIDWDGSNPSSQPYFLCRAKAMEMNGERGPVEALEQYNTAAHAWSRGHYRQSAGQFINCIKLDPEFLWAPNNLAWRYATCPDASARNGKEAVKYATYACRKSDWHCWSFIDTLSASYAEAGDFSKAISCSERALQMAPTRAKEGVQEMLRLFRAGKPCRDND